MTQVRDQLDRSLRKTRIQIDLSVYRSDTRGNGRMKWTIELKIEISFHSVYGQ